MTYTHGHAEPVLRSHRWRTADNSAAYLLPHLRDGQAVLDVGCGPATITADIARRFPASTVLGIDPAREVLEGVTEALPNLTVQVGDILAGDLPPDRFDVVHAHQILQHLSDPVEALRQMARVCRPGGIIAVRDADYGAMTWAPAMPDMDRWLKAYRSAHRDNGSEPDAGRHLLGWAHEAGLSDVTPSASAWCFATPEDRSWWAGLWADRVTAPESLLSRQLVARGHTPADLRRIATS
ncbi:MAG TPA: methyltransferase domain-containing protein, partial [Euzebya sp.]|nr:methyltransferase domain-containing protein [Euzebya sp.]